ncbi:MAG: 16S rRNA (uracil(1498)-N(3))-methyltransferase [Fermentimonas sp.]|jgi:16S rRNA (uracil1498-N3)-methyltransferase
MSNSDIIFYAPDIKELPELPAQESQHCVKVLRMRIGDEILVSDGKGGRFECVITDANHKRCRLDIVKEETIEKQRNYSVGIAFAPTKHIDRNEWFVEKATEIGIDYIIPLRTKYSERKEIKNERLEKIAVAAMKQSKQFYLPQIYDMMSFEEFVASNKEGQKFIAHCYDMPKKELTVAYKRGENVFIAIGPEGDFSEQEVELSMTHGFKPISLGTNRLRTETACLSALQTIHIINNL